MTDFKLRSDRNYLKAKASAEQKWKALGNPETIVPISKDSTDKLTSIMDELGLNK